MADVKSLGAMNAYTQAMKLGDALAAGTEPVKASGATPSQFMQLLDKGLDNTIASETRGEMASIASLSNKVSPADLAIAVNNADLTLRTIVNIRDRFIQAYQDIIKMPI